MKKVLTIAGSDCSGGAGIQADLKTMMAHNVYGMSVITALTAQNTTGVYGISEVDPAFVAKQLDCIFQDITPDSVKIGMVSSVGIIRTIANKLSEYGAKHVVVDPIMVATSGSKLLSDNAMEILVNHLFAVADLITPNLPEAECLCGFSVHNQEDMMKAAEKIASMCGAAILIKGGHLEDTAYDLLFVKGTYHWFSTERVSTKNTHGTGCTLSSAIACNLAIGYSMEESVKRAKDYITGALQAGLDLGKGNGPLHHGYRL